MWLYILYSTAPGFVWLSLPQLLVLYGFSFCVAAQIYVLLYNSWFWLAPFHNSWFYTASYVQLDSVIQIYLAIFPRLLFYTASRSVQLDFVAQIYVVIYFHTAPGFVWLLSNNSWFYMASYIQLDSVIQIYLATFIQLLVFLASFPWLLVLYGFSR